MCGIVGLFHPQDASVPEQGRLRRMANAIRHRGPDGDGFHCEPHVGFGHRRLAIVDLAGGAQPMATHDGEVIVTFNGEIYNHAALRQTLEAAGLAGVGRRCPRTPRRHVRLRALGPWQRRDADRA